MNLKELEKIVMAHIADSTNIQKALERNATNLDWLMKGYWVLVGGMFGLLGLLLKLVLTK